MNSLYGCLAPGVDSSLGSDSDVCSQLTAVPYSELATSSANFFFLKTSLVYLARLTALATRHSYWYPYVTSYSNMNLDHVQCLISLLMVLWTDTRLPIHT